VSKIFKLKRKFYDQQGQVAIIIALLLISFVGMTALVVDMGSMYEERRSLQSAADAAALAGAQELPESSAAAIQKATENIATNRPDISSIDIAVSTYFVANDQITVTVHNPDSPVYFGRVYGVNSANVSATATAIVGRPQIFAGIVPWGVVADDWVPGDEYTLKSGPPSHGGNFGALRIGGNGANNYKDNIINGVDVPLQVGDWIDTEPGNMTGPTNKGTETRIYDQADNTLNSFDYLTEPNTGGYKLTNSKDSQFVICPLISALPHGAGSVEILAFIPFIITGYSGSEVYGTFLNEALIVYTGGIEAVDETGIKVIRLIK
jgi:Flp pilus assembly protein TadG